MGSQGHGRGGGLGKALPQSDAWPQRNRNPAAVRDGGFAAMTRGRDVRLFACCLPGASLVLGAFVARNGPLDRFVGLRPTAPHPSEIEIRPLYEMADLLPES